MQYVYYRRRFHRLGIKLGFSIGFDSLGYAPWIPHHGTIVIGENNKIGNYACLHTSICITATNKNLGDGLFCATGVKLTNAQELGNDIVIAANSVVNKSFTEHSILIAGAPAEYKRQCHAWYWNSIHEKRVEMIEELKKKIFN